jgi:phosphatidyl-myo-inositol dimannoside synthase
MLLFSYDYPPDTGGISRLCAQIARTWHERVGAVSVLTRARTVGRVGLSGDSIATWELRVRSERPWRELDSWRFLREGRQLGPVVCGIWYPEGLVATLASARPRVILTHGTELSRQPPLWRRFAWTRLRRWVLESADLVVANSRYTEELVAAVAPRARVASIPLGVDPARFASGGRLEAKAKFGVDGRVVLSSVSRLEPYKGHALVLKAIAGLEPEERGQIAYLVAGTGPEEARLRALAAELGMQEQVRWLGFVDENELADVYRASDLFILCSHRDPAGRDVEGFGLVFLEAQACGVPVVGSRTGGIPDAISDGDGGWLIRDGDEDGLRTVVRRLIHDPLSFQQMGSRARARVERECTWDHYIRRFASALTESHVPLG